MSCLPYYIYSLYAHVFMAETIEIQGLKSAVIMMTLGGRSHKTNYSSDNGEELEMLKFHMSTSAKYLLISAILLKKSSRANA